LHAWERDVGALPGGIARWWPRSSTAASMWRGER
jgi:hypothetical protein